MFFDPYKHIPELKAKKAEEEGNLLSKRRGLAIELQEINLELTKINALKKKYNTQPRIVLLKKKLNIEKQIIEIKKVLGKK